MNGTYSPAEFIGGLPTITNSTSTIIQTITTVVSSGGSGGSLLKIFTNSTVCSSTV